MSIKWKEIEKEINIIKDGNKYYCKLEEFIKKIPVIKNHDEDGIMDRIKRKLFPAENSLHFKESKIWSKNKITNVIFTENVEISKLKLTKTALEFLENSKRGNAFCGIGDLKEEKLYLHPLLPNNARTIPTKDSNDLTLYDGPFRKNCVFYQQYISHDGSYLVKNTAEYKIVEQKKLNVVFKTGTSHVQLLMGIINKKYHNDFNLKTAISTYHREQKRFFGFSIINSGSNNNGDSLILSNNDKYKAALRIRSNTLNNGFENQIKIVQLADKKDYIELTDIYKTDRFKNITEIFKILDIDIPVINQDSAKKLAITVSNQIEKNRKLKKTLLIFNNTDVFLGN